MKYFRIVICIVVLVFLLVEVIFLLKPISIDAEYAVTFGEVISSYDIDKLDEYLDESTLITYKGVAKSYAELRENIETIFEMKAYKIGACYGHGNNKFNEGIQEVKVQISYTFHEYVMEMKTEYFCLYLRRDGINDFSVSQISSDEDFFGYLFFGVPIPHID